jgi:hypothetical protein
VLLGLPDCPNDAPYSPGNTAKLASQASCATWDPYENSDPPGCDWFDRPPEPADDGGGRSGGPVQQNTPGSGGSGGGGGGQPNPLPIPTPTVPALP